MGEPGSAIATAAADVEKAPDLKAARDGVRHAERGRRRGGEERRLDGRQRAQAGVLSDGQAVRGCRSQDTLQNPYYGQAMLDCGEFRKMQ